MRRYSPSTSPARPGVNTATVGQPHVHHHDIRLHDSRAPARRRHTVGRRHHIEAVVGQIARHRVTPYRMVVDDHHRRGIVSSHSVPHPGPVFSFALPPSQSIRPTIDLAI